MTIPQRILLQVAAGAGLVIAVATAVTYGIVYESARRRDLQHLETYVNERSRREEAGFKQVEANLALVRGAGLAQRIHPIEQRPELPRRELAEGALREAGDDGGFVFATARAHDEAANLPALAQDEREIQAGPVSAEEPEHHPAAGFRKAELMRLGVRATALDAARRLVTLADGATLSCDGLILATGARVRTLPGMPELAGLHVLRGLDDARRLRGALSACAGRDREPAAQAVRRHHQQS